MCAREGVWGHRAAVVGRDAEAHTALGRASSRCPRAAGEQLLKQACPLPGGERTGPRAWDQTEVIPPPERVDSGGGVRRGCRTPRVSSEGVGEGRDSVCPLSGSLLRDPPPTLINVD